MTRQRFNVTVRGVHSNRLLYSGSITALDERSARLFIADALDKIGFALLGTSDPVYAGRIAIDVDVDVYREV